MKDTDFRQTRNWISPPARRPSTTSTTTTLELATDEQKATQAALEQTPGHQISETTFGSLKQDRVTPRIRAALC